MEIKSLTNLTTNGTVFELYSTVITTNKNYGLYSFVCNERHSMRMDLVCYDIYENTDHIDILCNINSIMNPLTVNDGDIILFVEDSDLDAIRSNQNTFNAFFDALKNANKGKEYKRDQNRSKDVTNRTQTEKDKIYIPPNIVQSQNSNLSIESGKIVLRPNF
jgi:hypothetical protein